MPPSLPPSSPPASPPASPPSSPPASPGLSRYAGTPREARALASYVKLLRASDTVAGRLSAGIQETGLTMGQFAVLEALLHLGPLSQRELGQKLLRSGANVCTVVDNLEKAGHVERQRNSDDRRVVTVSLTRAGRQLIERVFPLHAAEVAELMSALSPEEQEQLGALCKKLGTGCTATRGREEPKEKER